ncbi:MAG: DUF4412 domain-containing protein [Endomicrobia bacterium]|nr:DUF4412 domain-containing protein [Endomicrobiia bacterium]MCL2507191.1 DUF4412 domain-containing protein [Endomicrobiia bacterium]
MKVLVKSICLSLLVLFCATAVFAGTVKEYSADIIGITTDKKGNKKEGLSAKIYATDKKMRQESFDEKGNLVGMAIIRIDKNKIYSFIEENKTYMEINFEGNEMPSPQQFANMLGGMADVKREKVGTETINGYKAEKHKTTVNTNIFGIKSTMISYDWTTAEYNYPIRTLYEDKKNGDTITEMRNIKAGKQPDSLFEIPKGYTKDESIEELGKTMGSLSEVMKKAKQEQAENAPASEKPNAVKNAGKSVGDEAAGTVKEVGQEVKNEAKQAGKDALKKGFMKAIGM